VDRLASAYSARAFRGDIAGALAELEDARQVRSKMAHIRYFLNPSL
jgi:hypothetical protein